MSGSDNITGKGFDAHPENINRKGREVGSKNRATVLRELLDVKITREDLDGNKTKMTVEQAVIQALALKALSGDVPAIKEWQDTLHGKIADKQELTGKDGEELKGVQVTFVKPEEK